MLSVDPWIHLETQSEDGEHGHVAMSIASMVSVMFAVFGKRAPIELEKLRCFQFAVCHYQSHWFLIHVNAWFAILCLGVWIRLLVVDCQSVCYLGSRSNPADWSRQQLESPTTRPPLYSSSSSTFEYRRYRGRWGEESRHDRDHRYGQRHSHHDPHGRALCNRCTIDGARSVTWCCSMSFWSLMSLWSLKNFSIQAFFYILHFFIFTTQIKTLNVSWTRFHHHRFTSPCFLRKRLPLTFPRRFPENHDWV